MLKALIFDMDGTLVNTDPLHFAAYKEVLRPYGFDLQLDFYQREMSGIPNMDLMKKLLPQLSLEEQREVVALKEKRFKALARGLGPVPGTLELLSWLDERRLKRAVVTSAPRDNVRALLEGAGLWQRFLHIVYAEELPKAKPDPLPYVVALQELGLKAEEAIAFEDAPAGVRSAVGAGILTVGLATTQPPEHLLAAGAGMVVKDFKDEALREMLEDHHAQTGQHPAKRQNNVPAGFGFFNGSFEISPNARHALTVYCRIAMALGQKQAKCTIAAGPLLGR